MGYFPDNLITLNKSLLKSATTLYMLGFHLDFLSFVPLQDKLRQPVTQSHLDILTTSKLGLSRSYSHSVTHYCFTIQLLT